MDLQSLISDLKLGIRAVLILPLRRMVQNTGGLRRFEQSFFPERLLPTSLEDRTLMREASRCLACGVCDAAFAGEGDGAGLRPSLLASVYARSRVELPFAMEDVRRLAGRPELLRTAERLCPTGVPLERLARGMGEGGGEEG
jgi:hypothetical protein